MRHAGALVTLHVGVMLGPIIPGHQHVDVLPQHLQRGIAEQAFGGAIEHLHAAVAVNEDHGVHRRIEQGLQFEGRCLRFAHCVTCPGSRQPPHK